jgi:thiol-disulfide isomerase/thioredoxin
MKRTFFLFLASALALGGSLFGAELGDEAKPLAIAKWVKGKKVDMAKGKGKKVYVVEFWATWCAPCLTTIPHLTELQKKYKEKGVVFIGVSDEKASVVKNFVEKMGDKMDYVVAIDDDEKTTAAFMAAFGQTAIPHAFIVDKEGRVAWHGHPMDKMDEKLDKILAGEYDIAKAAEEEQALEERAQKTLDYFRRIIRGDDGDATDALGDELLARGADDVTFLNNLSWGIMTQEKVQYRNRGFALRLAKAAFDASDGETGFVLDTYARALYEDGQLKKALEMQKKAIKHAKDRDERKLMEVHLDQFRSGFQ